MVIFNEEKLKYECLDMLLGDIISDIRFTSVVNVIVDVKEIFKKVFRPNVFPENPNIGRITEEISSDIIGLVSHYRNYFFKKGKYTSFYFLYSNSECVKMKNVFSDYKKEHYEKYYRDDSAITKVKNRVLFVIEKFLNSLPNTSYIDCSEFEDISVLKFLKNKIPENQFTLLLSNDNHWFQGLDKARIFAINCKGIKSDLIRDFNSVSYITGQDTKISSNMIPFILSIAGSKKYSIPNIKGIGVVRALSIVNQLLQNGKIQDTEYLNFPIKKEILDASNKNEAILIENFDDLKRNYELISCTDIIYSNELKISELFNKSKPILSANKLMDINAKLFTNYPINLDMLLKGESFK